VLELAFCVNEELWVGDNRDYQWDDTCPPDRKQTERRVYCYAASQAVTGIARVP